MKNQITPSPTPATTPIAKETLKPKRQKKLSNAEYTELVIKETKQNIQDKFHCYINFLLYNLSKKDIEFEKIKWELKDILELHEKMKDVLEGINNNRVCSY